MPSPRSCMVPNQWPVCMIRCLVDLEAVDEEVVSRDQARRARVEAAVAITAAASGGNHLAEGLKWDQLAEETKEDITARCGLGQFEKVGEARW